MSLRHEKILRWLKVRKWFCKFKFIFKLPPVIDDFEMRELVQNNPCKTAKKITQL